MVSYKENERLISKEGEREEKIREKKADMGAASWLRSDLGFGSCESANHRCELTAKSDAVKTPSWTQVVKIWGGESLRAPFLGVGPKRGFTCWKWPGMLEIQQKTRKKIQSLYLLSNHDMLLLFAELMQSTRLLYSLLFPDDYLQIVVVNKPLGS